MTKIKRYGKESNPEALYSKDHEKPKYVSGNLKTASIDIFAPRGDNAKDAFDRELFDMIKYGFDD